MNLMCYTIQLLWYSITKTIVKQTIRIFFTRNLTQYINVDNFLYLHNIGVLKIFYFIIQYVGNPILHQY